MPRVDDAAVGQHRLDRVDDVLDVAVGGAELPGGARGDPTADAADGDRLRPVSDREAVRGDRILGVAAARAGVELRQQVHRVDGSRLMHRRQIEHDALRVCDNAAADTAAEAERNDRDIRIATRIDRRDDVVDGAWTDDTARARRAAALQIVEVAQHPIVVAPLVEGRRVGEHFGRSEPSCQRLDEGVSHDDRAVRVQQRGSRGRSRSDARTPRLTNRAAAPSHRRPVAARRRRRPDRSGPERCGGPSNPRASVRLL